LFLTEMSKREGGIINAKGGKLLKSYSLLSLHTLVT